MPGYDEWLDAFWSLSTERQIGMGVGPIPHSALTKEVADRDLDEIEAQIFLAAMRRLDRTYLTHVSEQHTAPGGTKRPVVSSREMTPALFDALF